MKNFKIYNGERDFQHNNYNKMFQIDYSTEQRRYIISLITILLILALSYKTTLVSDHKLHLYK